MFDHEIPLGFIGYPQDIGAVAAFLSSDDARYITGQVLFVDGGTSCRMFLGVTKEKTDLLDDVKTLEKKE
jgi:enoyl-[acyl-carrier-protein] reductase (NADH)